MGKSRWRRRWKIGGAVFFTVLAVGIIALWLALPRLVEMGARRAARDLGFDETTITVGRADFSGLRAGDVHVRKGGLEATLKNAGADYALTALLGGKIGTINVEGLTVTLDFTKPRRSLLPDAVTELLAKIPHSDEPLVWPIARAELKDCRLVLVLPGGPQTFSIAGSATRAADGNVAFELHSQHPEQELNVKGRVRTETFDGTIDVTNLSLQPAFLLRIASQLGLFDLPADTTIDSDRIALSGRVVLKGGVPETFSLEAHTPRLAGAFGDVAATIETFALSGSRDGEGELKAALHASVGAASKSAAWSAGPAQLDLSLDDGRIHGSFAAVPVRWQNDASARVTLSVDAGIPPLGGPKDAKITATLDDARYGATEFAPIELVASGWLDRVQLTTKDLRLATDSPAALRDVSLALTNLSEATRAFQLTAGVAIQPVLAAKMPAGWRLDAPAFPVDLLNLDVRGTLTAEGPSGTATITSRVPHLEIGADDKQFSSSAALDITATIDPAGVAASGTIGVSEIKTDMSKFPPGVQAMSFGVEIPRVAFTALGELAAGRVPKDEIAAKLKGSVARGEARGDSYLEVHHFGTTSEWEAEVWVMLDNLNGAWAGTNVSGTRVEVTLNSGHMPDARVGEWLRAPELVPILREVVPRSKLDVTITASSLDFPGKTRAEWSGFWIKKPPATDGTPALNATITAYSGIFHAGPKTVEQPSIEFTLAGGLDAFDVGGKFHALLEGSPVDIEAKQAIAFNWSDFSASGSGPFTIHPIVLKNSDIISRWSAGAKGIVIGASAQASGTFTWSTTGEWDGTADIALADGLFDYPDQKLRAEGIETSTSLTSLKNLRTLRGQPMRFARLAIGDIEITNGDFRFSTDGGSHVLVDGARARIFGGDVAVGSFLLIFPDPDVGVVLAFEGIDAGELVRQLKLFKGTLTGRLRGKLPLGLLAGKPILGEGYLELDPRYPSVFSMDATGLFTTDLPNKTPKDKIVRLPYEIAEEAMRNIVIKTLRIDLFRRDQQDIPIRLEFTGESATPRATVPVSIVTNVKGSFAEALNFLLRLATL